MIRKMQTKVLGDFISNTVYAPNLSHSEQGVRESSIVFFP